MPRGPPRAGPNGGRVTSVRPSLQKGLHRRPQLGANATKGTFADGSRHGQRGTEKRATKTLPLNRDGRFAYAVLYCGALCCVVLCCVAVRCAVLCGAASCVMCCVAGVSCCVVVVIVVVDAVAAVVVVVAVLCVCRGVARRGVFFIADAHSTTSQTKHI